MINIDEIRPEELDVQGALDELKAQRSPLREGTYVFELADVTDFVLLGKEKKFPQAVVTFKTEDKRVPFQRLGFYQILELLMAMGVEEVPDDARGLAETLVKCIGKKFKGTAYWEAFSVAARDQKLMDLTGSDTIDAAKALATKEDWNAANRAGTLASRMADFPTEDGEPVPEVVCPVSGETVPASVRVRYFKKA